MSDTIFDKIVRGEIPSYKVWEDDKHLAFLTPHPNTPGFTVVLPKNNPGANAFAIRDSAYTALMEAAKQVAKLLEKGLGVKRVVLVIEGTSIAYAHVKLIPLHGKLACQTGAWSDHTEFHPEYIGYITTAEGPEMSPTELKAIQAKIIKAAKP